jgi:hypothetical protein
MGERVDPDLRTRIEALRWTAKPDDDELLDGWHKHNDAIDDVLAILAATEAPRKPVSNYSGEGALYVNPNGSATLAAIIGEEREAQETAIAAALRKASEYESPAGHGKPARTMHRHVPVDPATLYDLGLRAQWGIDRPTMRPR